MRRTGLTAHAHSQLQREKDQLERAVEGQGDAIALKLRLALLAYEQQKPQPGHAQRQHRASKSRTGSSSSSVSTSASNSSSVSFPSSPLSSSLVSPILPAPDLAPDVLVALRENETLRVRLANSERVNAYYQRELAELRRRCGISIDELEELDLSPFAAGSSGNGGGGASSYPRQRSLSRTSRLDMYGGPSSSSIRIPGAAASVSPPGGAGGGGGLNSATGGAGRRSLTSSFMFSPDGARSARFASNSYTSSINTTATTPSSSYPNPRPPAATPATNAAFSPASANGNLALGLGGAGLGLGSNFATNGFAAAAASAASSHPLHHHAHHHHQQGFAERRNSLNGLVAAHFAAPSLQSDPGLYSVSGSAGGGGGGRGGGGAGAGTGIDMDDLVSLGGSEASSSRSGSTDSRGGGPRASATDTDQSTTAVPPTTIGSAEREPGGLPPFPGSRSLSRPPPLLPPLTAGVVRAPASSASAAAEDGPAADDPLVAAITRSLAKLVAEGSATLVDESEGDESDLSSAAGGPSAPGETPWATEEGEETDGDGAETPLSSGASRTGSMRRRYFS